ncbi:MAG TPA: hypothetical protein VF273_03075 [Pelobium sp.]
MEKFKLIEGHFSAKDAREILLLFIAEKIKFHELKSFSEEVKTGVKSKEAAIKVQELKNTRNKIMELISVESDGFFSLRSYVEVEEIR